MRRARANAHTITAVLGPTNTGKTHYALERMLAHDSGMIGLPLRLLAREIYDTIAAKCGPQSVALITGEEKIVPRAPRYFVSTVEAMPLDRTVAFLAVDEIQMCEDPERGHVFTDRLLHARGTHETLLLGAETIRPLLNKLLPGIKYRERARFSDLSYTGPRKLSRLPRRSAIVSFSSDSVYSIAELIRRQRGGAAVVMGALSPRTRNAQVELYQSGDVDYLVATDAIGMGLNMDVDHIAFAALSKFDGMNMRPLKATEAAQIAGRAGRFMNDGTFGTTADCPKFAEEMIEQIESHRFDPIRAAFWRNRSLDFSSLHHLIRSLEMPAPAEGLSRTRAVTDVLALKGLGRDEDVRDVASSISGLKCLWDVCQIPDFRQVMLDEHINLLRAIFAFLVTPPHQIPEDWLNTRLKQLDRTDGDIDTLSNRIAHIRTWTYVANRSSWLHDSAHWCGLTRSLEDKLSDALHERLTQQFVDRRTSVLIKNLRERTDLLAGVSDDGEVTVEGEYVGRLMGFKFQGDPRARGIHGKALRNAATRALVPELARRALALAEAKDDDIQLKEHGKLWWRDAPVATLFPGKDWLHPRLDGQFGDLTDAPLIQQATARLENWLKQFVHQHLGHALRWQAIADGKLKDAPVGPVTAGVRGLCFQLFENMGILERSSAADELRALSVDERKMLRRLGVRLGAYALYDPKLLKPHASDISFNLVRVWRGEPALTLPGFGNRSLCSIEAAKHIEPVFYNARGFVVCGGRAVRVDMIDRLLDVIRVETKRQTAERRAAAAPAPAPLDDYAILAMLGPKIAPRRNRKKNKKALAGFAVTPEMMSLVGCSGVAMEAVLKHLGFRPITLPPDSASAEPDLFMGAPATAAPETLWSFKGPGRGRAGVRKAPSSANSGTDLGAPASGEILSLDAHVQKRQTGTTHNAPARKSAERKPRRRSGGHRAPAVADSPFAILATLKGVK